CSGAALPCRRSLQQFLRGVEADGLARPAFAGAVCSARSSGPVAACRITALDESRRRPLAHELRPAAPRRVVDFGDLVAARGSWLGLACRLWAGHAIRTPPRALREGV